MALPPSNGAITHPQSQPEGWRVLDAGEAFFAMLDRVSCMNFVVWAERDAPLDGTRLCAALDAVQQRHANLQVGLHWSEAHGLCFEPVGLLAAHPIDCTLTAGGTLDDAVQNLVEAELGRPFAPDERPLMRCRAWSGATQSVLALCFHHAVADGRSGLSLLREVLSLLQQDTVHSEPVARPPLPPLHSVAPELARWRAEPQAMLSSRQAMGADLRRHGPVSPSPWLKPNALAQSPRVVRQNLLVELSTGLRQQARAQACTVNAALCAAQLLAQQHLPQAQPQAVRLLSFPVDLRPHLAPAQADTPLAMRASLLSSTYALGADTQLWALARAIHQQTRAQIARAEGLLLYPLLGLHGQALPPQAFAPFAEKMRASLPQTMVSNVGEIAPVASDSATTRIAFALGPMPHQTLFTAASCYQGAITLNLGWDAQQLSESDVAQQAAQIQTLLQQALSAADS
jgi:NRPS condensation-like uncharacterized protein